MPPGEIHDRIEAITREEHCELIRFIQQYTKSSYIAEEILQEAYLEALRCADQIKCPDKLISWLKTVSKRMAISELEKQNRLLRKCLRFIDSVSLTWDEKLVDQIVISDTLERILKTTPPYYRSVILYRYTYGMSYYQISRNLGISVIAARQINSRIIRRLRNEILNNFKEDNI